MQPFLPGTASTTMRQQRCLSRVWLLWFDGMSLVAPVGPAGV